ncbi:hypothetical protein EBB07_10715 [Paenibacillaceae bacterium]|nr:hypothetical protein EBB07_10715 [Paenibacillaceae bacterium]
MKPINFYKQKLQRYAWHLQNKARKRRRRECQLIEEMFPVYHNETNIDDQILVKQLLDEIPNNTGNKVIRELFLRDKTEAQLARELNISQQAVSKWKKKTLHQILQRLSS